MDDLDYYRDMEEAATYGNRFKREAAYELLRQNPGKIYTAESALEEIRDHYKKLLEDESQKEAVEAFLARRSDRSAQEGIEIDLTSLSVQHEHVKTARGYSVGAMDNASEHVYYYRDD